jgi:ubiquinone/menaquinone biosynthesis C-methylase UbiE
METYPELYQYLAQKTQNQLPKSITKPIILDLGMGPGLLSVELHRTIPNARIIGLDPSEEMIKLAQDHARNNDFNTFTTLHSTAENIPLADATVDIIVSRFSLPYWHNPNQVFLEIYRILKPKSKLLLETLNREFPRWKLRLVQLHMLFNRASQSVIRYHIDAYNKCYTIDEIEQFLNTANLCILEKEGDKKDWKYLLIAEKTPVKKTS